MEMIKMNITIYGTRGSYPSPSDRGRNFYTDKYGGHTTSLLVEPQGDELIHVDLGSGSTQAGIDLINRGTYSKEGKEHTVLITHFHADHTEGTPYLKPLYDPRNTFHIHGNADPRVVEELLGTRQNKAYFPVAYQAVSTGDAVPFMMAKKIHYSLNGKEISKSIDITFEQTNHPGGCVAYKFNENGKIFAFSGDHEFGVQSIDDKLRDFYKNSQIILHDCQYLPEERNPAQYGLKGIPKAGWGHADFKQLIDFMLKVQPEVLILTHHDPEHDDKFIDEMHAKAQEYARVVGLESKIVMATPGMKLIL